MNITLVITYENIFDISTFPISITAGWDGTTRIVVMCQILVVLTIPTDRGYPTCWLDQWLVNVLVVHISQMLGIESTTDT